MALAVGPAVSRLQGESDKKHAMTQILWDSGVNRSIRRVKISMLITPYWFVHGYVRLRYHCHNLKTDGTFPTVPVNDCYPFLSMW